MLLPRFDFHRPGNLAEACQMMAEFGDRAKILAGGTDLLVHMKHGRLKPEFVVDLSGIEAMESINANNGAIAIGAMATIAEIATGGVLAGKTDALVQAAGNLGSPLVRNRATLGGNLASARPAADTAPPLMAYGASVVLSSDSGERTVPLDEFFQGPGLSLLKPDEILSRIEIPTPPPGTGGACQKLGLRKAMEIGIVNAAAVITLESDGATIASARVFLGSVAPTPIRSPEAESTLVGAKAGPDTFAKAGKAAVGDSCAIDDFRGTEGYRCEMVEVLTKRALAAAFEQARKA